MATRGIEKSPPSSIGKCGFRGHIAELDCIRGVGIAVVLLNHLWPTDLFPVMFRVFQLGWIAMDAFFVLSGFLITGILVDTRSRPDYFRNYYARRSLRIFPLYYVTLLVAIVMLKLSHGVDYRSFTHDWGSPAWFFFYLGNLRMAYLGEYPPTMTFGVLWSLQIEEQFYLLFPLAVRYMRLDRLSRLLWCLVFVSPLFRVAVFVFNPGNRLAQNVLLPCHMEGLALGALIAIRFRNGPWELSKAALTVVTIGLTVLACLGSVMSRPSLDPNLTSFNRVVGYSLSSWACACIVVWLIAFRGSRFTRLLRSALIGYLATISYGVYLLHPLVIRFVRSWGRIGVDLPYRSFRHCVVVVGLSIIAASVSWYGFERPIARLKDRLVPSRQPGLTDTAG